MSGAILSREGLSVCILEKNEQIGGALQTFRFKGHSLDTGIHYIGGLDKGQTLHQIFNYLGLMKRIELTRMNENGYDMIPIIKRKAGLGEGRLRATGRAHAVIDMETHCRSNG